MLDALTLAETRVVFTLLAWLALLPLLVSLLHLRRLKELHHGYYGLLLVAAGNLMASAAPVAATVLVIVGAALTVEDTGQHWEQARWWRPGMPRLTGADDHWPVHRWTYALLRHLGLDE